MGIRSCLQLVQEPDRVLVKLFGFKLLKIKVMKLQSSDSRQILNYLAYFQSRILFLQHYNIQIPGECCGLGNRFELVQIKLKDLKRDFFGIVYPLKQCSQFRYLQMRDQKIYEDYIQKHIDKGWCSSEMVWTVERLISLEGSIKKAGYDPSKSIIAVNQDNVILDGVHRSCVLLYLYGPEYVVQAVKVYAQ